MYSEAIEDSVNDDVSPPNEYVWEDDGELVIVTYDVYGSKLTRCYQNSKTRPDMKLI